MNKSPQAHETNATRHYENADGVGAPSENLRDSPLMARLLDALEAKTDVGHYGQFTFASVARHFMDEDEIVSLLAKQPDFDEEKARALVAHVAERGYNPPRRERILEQQARQTFQLIENPDDPDAGNLYRELQFPDAVYEHISEYYGDRAEAQEHSAR